ncbi:MAG: Rieske 2Fe-2S domain-containing protein [Actinomycetota bacterium]|nr:Rieske 2Fe-2S domain-containing protein [Actinomycetota bacterium]
MAAPNIPAAKRAGLPVDLPRLEAEGDAWLSPEDRYALKTWGVCTQEQPGVFMIRVRNPGGALPTPQARGVARISRSFGPDWLHLTTRQNFELHWVEDRRVPALLDAVAEIGMTTRSGCGHTLRNVMCSEDAGSNLDEPFDCLPDARAVSDAIVARSAELNCALPSRINIAFGGSPRCRADARLNDAGFVSVLHEGKPGYELWAGGSLGKAPFLAVKVADFVARSDVAAAAEALIEVFVEHGDLDKPTKGRMKYVVERLGEAAFRAAWDQAFAAAQARPQPPAPPIELLAEADRVAILSHVPPGGWSAGVQPQRTPGLATLTVDIPLGDTNGSELELCCDLADRHGDGALNLSRDQNIVLRSVPVAAVTAVRQALATRGLFLAGEAHTASVRACTGSAVCALGITTAPEAGKALLASPALGRNSSLRVHVSGCPNSCAQHQAGDIGLAGSKVRLGGATRDGYHVYLGADLPAGRVGEVVGRVATEDVPATVEAVVGIWEAMRHEGEPLGVAVARIGHDAFARHLESVMAERWASGPEPEVASAGSVTPVTVARVVDLTPGSVTTVDAAGTPVALANVDGTFCAVADTCPHAGASLGSGTLRGTALECPRHGGTFDLRTGAALAGPTEEPVRTLAVSVADGAVQVMAPAMPAPAYTGG